MTLQMRANLNALNGAIQQVNKLILEWHRGIKLQAKSKRK